MCSDREQECEQGTQTPKIDNYHYLCDLFLLLLLFKCPDLQPCESQHRASTSSVLEFLLSFNTKVPLLVAWNSDFISVKMQIVYHTAPRARFGEICIWSLLRTPLAGVCFHSFPGFSVLGLWHLPDEATFSLVLSERVTLSFTSTCGTPIRSSFVLSKLEALFLFLDVKFLFFFCPWI